MFIDKIQRIFGTTRFQSMLLEVFAIFLGITASFAVEEWREERQDRENYERYLAAIYYDALREQALARRFTFGGSQSVASIDMLLHRDFDELSDFEMMTLARQVFGTWSLPRHDASFRALQASGIPAPFDDTMQALNASYELNLNTRTHLDATIVEHNRMASMVRRRHGTVSNPGTVVINEDRTVMDGTRFDQPAYTGIRRLFFEDGVFLPGVEGMQRIREGLNAPDIRRVLSEELERVMQAMDLAIGIAETAHSVQKAIRDHLPNLRLSVRSLAVVGDATPGAWAIEHGVPMRRAGETGDWWSAEMELTDGAVKFVANGVWGTSWGAPIQWQLVDPLMHDRQFPGDPDAVFPGGIAEFDALNIPVRAGRYEVRFNTHTFEYQFNALGGQAIGRE